MEKDWKKKRNLLIVLAVVFVLIFSFSISERATIRGKAANTIGRNYAAFVDGVNFDVPAGIRSLVFYMSHGYTGLAYAMKLPFEWTYFVGNSRALTQIVESNFLHSDIISSNTYAQRLQDVYGWNNGEIWPSCFVWLASDITFWMIPLLIYCVAKLFSKALYEAVKEQSVISLTLASYLMIFFVYLPANNQIVQSDRSLFALILLGLLYFAKCKRICILVGKWHIRIK